MNYNLPSSEYFKTIVIFLVKVLIVKSINLGNFTTCVWEY